MLYFILYHCALFQSWGATLKENKKCLLVQRSSSTTDGKVHVFVLFAAWMNWGYRGYSRNALLHFVSCCQYVCIMLYGTKLLLVNTETLDRPLSPWCSLSLCSAKLCPLKRKSHLSFASKLQSPGGNLSSCLCSALQRALPAVWILAKVTIETHRGRMAGKQDRVAHANGEHAHWFPQKTQCI